MLRVQLHSVVVRTAATLRRDPGNDLVRIHDVAGLAMDTVGEVHRDLFCAGHIRSFDHLVNLCRTEMLAGISVFDRAARIADVGVVNDKMRGLVVVVLGSGVIDISELVED